MTALVPIFRASVSLRARDCVQKLTAGPGWRIAVSGKRPALCSTDATIPPPSPIPREKRSNLTLRFPSSHPSSFPFSYDLSVLADPPWTNCEFSARAAEELPFYFYLTSVLHFPLLYTVQFSNAAFFSFMVGFVLLS
ncbi:hypothetical protein MRX96_007385 [Rhipicephalus microplus]